MSKKPRNPKPGAGFTTEGGTMFNGSGDGHKVMRRGKTARDRAKRARENRR
jgi:hypothetical protein